MNTHTSESETGPHLVPEPRPLMLVRCDAQERYVFVNQAYAKHRNRPSSEILGKTVSEIVGEENYQVLLPYIRRVLTGESVQFEREIFYPATGLRIVSVSFEPEIDEDGKVAGWVSAISDLTEARRSQSELNEVRARIESTLQVAEIGTWVWDVQKNIVHADKNLSRIFFGAEKEDAPIEDFIQAIHSEDRDRVMREIENSQTSESGTFECDYRIARSNGDVRWTTARGSVQKDENGNPVKFSGVVIDITHRKLQQDVIANMSQEMETQARVFSAALSSIPDFIYTFNREGRFIFANKPLLDLWGLSLDEAIGKNFFDLQYPEALATRLQREIEQVFRTHQSVTGETPSISPTGEPGYYEYIFSPVIDSEGRLEAVAGSTRVITERKRQEAAVSDLLQRIDAQARLFDATLSHIADLAYTFDQNARVIYANKPLLDIWGLTLAEAVGKNCFDLQYPTELAEKLNGQLLEVIRTGACIQGVTELTGVNGVTDVHEYIYNPVFDPDGKAIAVAGTTRLITQRNQMERALRESEQRLSRIMALMPSGVYSCDVEGRFTFFNRRAAELWGQEPQLMDLKDRFCACHRVFQPDGTYIPPDATPMAMAVREGRAFRGTEAYVERPDGSRFLVSVNIDPILDDEGKVIGAINVFQDITGQKEAEGAARRLAAIVESSDDAIVSKNLDGIVTSWNRGAEFLFGYSAAEMIGKPISTLIPPDRMGEEAEILRRVRKGERSDHYETIRLRKDGTEVEVSLAVSAIRDREGKVIGASKIARNISRQKRVEADLREAKESAEAANRSKDRFLAVLSHELRTPLTPVLMSVAIRLMDPELTPAARADMEMIKRNIELETKIIDDLLDLSRITSGKLNLRREAVDLNTTVKQVAEICRSQILEKGIRAHFEFDERAGEVMVDSSRFQQVLWNILKNAAKFTPDGGAIFLKTFVKAGNRMGVEVRDTGVGISAEALPKIFDAFEQGDPAISRQFGGMGLGLAISKALIELHEGSIRATSSGQDQGSTFTIELPGLTPSTSALKKPTANDSKRSKPLRLLIAEDHEDSAILLARLLRASGHEVATAGTVTRALELAEQQPFDLLISDVGLPDATGYELMQKIRLQQPLKGIAMSGYGMEEDIKKSLEAGFSEHLVKPVDVIQLEQTIVRVAKSK